MTSLFVNTDRMESRYCYRVSKLLNIERTTLIPGDIFRFTIRVYHSTSPLMILLNCPSQTIPCHRFFQEGQNFLRTLLSLAHFFIESLEDIVERVVPDVRELFQVDAVASETQPQEIRLWLQIKLFDTDLLAAVEESMQCFRMIPASNEAIQTSLKKSTVITRSECCPICLEAFDVNAECYAMPCHHVFHQQCIVTWLRTSHVCPLCRYSLPTLIKD